MPELPDIEIFKRYLDATCLHQAIEAVDLKNSSMLKGVSGKRLTQRLRKNQFKSSRRHGKYLFAELHDGGWLVLHFGMTGFLKYYKIPAKEPAHNRFALILPTAIIWLMPACESWVRSELPKGRTNSSAKRGWALMP